MMVSSSIPTNSLIWVTFRLPSGSRSRCTITLMALTICARIARTGRSKPAMSTNVSILASASRGLLA